MMAGKPKRAGCVREISPRAGRKGARNKTAGSRIVGREFPPEVVVVGWKVERHEVKRAKYVPSGCNETG